MKTLIIILSLLLLTTACSFAPLAIPVADSELTAVNTLGTICYGEVHKRAPANFSSVRYLGDALYTSGNSVGPTQRLDIVIYARASDPLPGASLAVKCVLQAGEADEPISEKISLLSGIKKHISAGGGTLAGIVTHDKYWIGISTTDAAFLSFPGSVKLSNGSIEAYF